MGFAGIEIYQYPAEGDKLIKPVQEGRADMAIGDRFTNGTYQKK